MKRLNTFCLTWFVFMLPAAVCFAADVDTVASALSGRHQSTSYAELEKIVGNDDRLIDILLELREHPTSFVAIRTEQLLVEVSDNELVANVLEQDLQDPNLKGFARAIVGKIDKAPTVSRERLARAALASSENDASFRAYTERVLGASRHSGLRQLTAK